ncbi:hypothetical protein [Agrobacterium sp. P15N1-A]|uniref:hypothetical protein n=1 Tax=Agrobacterium sp. P15N1-A TaxID=3342820 RepID=UPI0037D8965A
MTRYLARARFVVPAATKSSTSGDFDRKVIGGIAPTSPALRNSVVVLCAALCFAPQAALSWDDFKGRRPAEANAGQADPDVAASHEPALTIQTFAGSASDSAASGASSCFPVDTIRIEGGHELIGSEAVEDVTRPFALSCQNVGFRAELSRFFHREVSHL